MKTNFNGFLPTYFGADYDEELTEKWESVIIEISLYFENRNVEGWSSYYCKKTWNDETLENEADFEIFDLLFKIDIKNGADTSKIVDSLCKNGAFEAVKVSDSFLFMKSLLCSLL